MTPAAKSSTFCHVCEVNPAAVIGYAFVSPSMPEQPKHRIVLELSLAIQAAAMTHETTSLAFRRPFPTLEI